MLSGIKSDLKRGILYDPTYMCNLEKTNKPTQTHSNRSDQRLPEVGVEMMGWGLGEGGQKRQNPSKDELILGMYNIVTIVKYCTGYLKVVKKLDLKSSWPEKKNNL